MQKWSKEFPASPASSNDILPNDSSLWKKQTNKPENWDFPGDPVVKNLSSYAEHAGSIPGQATKILHATGQLSLCPTANPTG